MGLGQRRAWIVCNVGLLAGITLTGMLLTSSTLTKKRQTPEEDEVAEQVIVAAQDPIHIVLSTDDADLRPLVVCIRSAVSSCQTPQRLVFHVISTSALARRIAVAARIHLPSTNVHVHHNTALELRIRSLICCRQTSLRAGLFSPFNFAPFYVHEFTGLELARVIYFDTDTIVTGDVGELHRVDLGEHPCGAAKYCDQRLQTYIDVELIKRHGWGSFNRDDCVANRGVLVVNLPVWQAKNLTPKIEEWVRRQTAKMGNNSKPLWRSGMSQAPWLLAMNGDYLDIGSDWNCHGLGRATMQPKEASSLQAGDNILTDSTLKEIGARRAADGLVRPFVALCSKGAKLLHFNGPIKPWLLDGIVGPRQPLPLCLVPRILPIENTYEWQMMRTDKGANGRAFVPCREIWDAFAYFEYFIKGNSSMDVTDRGLLERELRKELSFWW